MQIITTDTFQEMTLGGDHWIMFKTAKHAEAEDGKTYDVEIKQHRVKRSLDANAYAWVLIDKLAEALNRTKTDVYRDTIREIGGNSTIVCVQNNAVDALVSGWEKNGIGWLTQTLPSKIDGCTNVMLFYGSSTYDTRQMSRMIDLLIQDAKALGIETMTPLELSRLIDDWNG